MDLKLLNEKFKALAELKETESPIISCYVNNETINSNFRMVLDARVKELRKMLSDKHQLDFEKALAKIEVFLADGIKVGAKGIAMFSRSGDSPFFDVLQFRLPFDNSFSIDSVPHLSELVTLKDTYHRYIILISTKTHARIIEVNVGSITKEVWTKRPELRERIGREWTKDQYQNHSKDRARKFMKEKIAIIESLFRRGGHTHLILAGNPSYVARVRKQLPTYLRNKLVDTIPMSGKADTEDVVSATLSTFADYEQRESLDTVELFLDELMSGQLALAGPKATLQALTQGQVDVLLMSEYYTPQIGWKCNQCSAVGVNSYPRECPRCGRNTITLLNIKEEMIRTAVKFGVTVEIVRNSDALLEVGGIGCLVRYLTPQQHMRLPQINNCSVGDSGIEHQF